MKPHKVFLFLLCILLCSYVGSLGLKEAPAYISSINSYITKYKTAKTDLTATVDSSLIKAEYYSKLNFFTPDSTWFLNSDLDSTYTNSIYYNSQLEENPLAPFYRLILAQKDSAFLTEALKSYSEYGDIEERNSMRILFYTNSSSNIEKQNRLLPSFRRHAQKTFGGKGLGILPLLNPNENPAIEIKKSRLWESIRMADQKRSGNYGICEGYITPPPVWMVNPSLKKSDYGMLNLNISHLAWGDRLEILTHEDVQAQDISCYTKEATLECISSGTPHLGLRLFNFRLPNEPSPLEIKIRLSRNSRVYALSIYSDSGIYIDNIIHKGYYSSFTSQHRRFLSENYRLLGSKLIVYALNENILPKSSLKQNGAKQNGAKQKTIKSDTAKSDTANIALLEYEQNLLKEITYLRAIAPMIPILIVGPTDKEYPNADLIRQVQRRIADINSCAFWFPITGDQSGDRSGDRSGAQSNTQSDTQTDTQSDAGKQLFNAFLKDLRSYTDMERSKL